MNYLQTCKFNYEHSTNFKQEVKDILENCRLASLEGRSSTQWFIKSIKNTIKDLNELGFLVDNIENDLYKISGWAD